MIRVGSICSGIEAASQAAPDNWEFSFFSEIEKFPSAVLAHHYPDTPNLGDFTSIKAADWPDVTLLCGGPPCQTFSIAGNRDGLNDERGNLTLDYVRMMHDFADNGLIWGLYENVPGILSDKTNAFGYFLSGIVGGDAPLCPPDAEWGEWAHDPLWVEVGRDKNDNPIREEAASCGGTYGWKSIRWPSQGMVEGPRARAAWDILDAQWFGLAQRRKRVFVVISFADDRDPAKVLFERKGLLGNSPPSRETGQVSARTSMARAGDGSHWSGSEVHPSLNQSNSTSGIGASNQEIFSQGGAGLVPDKASALTQRPYVDGGAEKNNLLVSPIPQTETVGALTDGAHNGGGLNGQDAYTGRIFPVAFSSKNSGQDAIEELSPTLRAGSHDKSHPNGGVPPAIAIQDAREIQKNQNGLGVNSDDTAYTVDTRATQAVAFKPSHYTRGKDGKPSEITPPLTADADKGDQEGVVLAPIAFNSRQDPVSGDVSGGLDSRATQAVVFPQPNWICAECKDHFFDEYALDKDSADSLCPPECPRCGNEEKNVFFRDEARSGPFAFAQNLRDEVRLQGGDGKIAGALSAHPGMKQRTYIAEPGSPPVYEVHGQDSRVTEMGDLCNTVTAKYGTGGGNVPVTINLPYAVRRLTPVECERLMGFKDNYTLIDYTSRASNLKIAEDVEKYAIRMGYDTQDEKVIRQFMCPDGPRYKALGNSWAVPVVKWIFDRIELQEAALRDGL